MAEVLSLNPQGALPDEALDRAVQAAGRGEIVAFPTDTVYGLGTSALSRAGVESLYRLKARDPKKPLPLLAASSAEARRWVEWTPQAEALVRRFWPGGLTLVLRANPAGRLLACSAGPTLAVRVPAQSMTRRLLERSGTPWASTSANLSGEPPLSDGAAIARAFAEKIAFSIDAGPVPGRQSTVVDAAASPVLILREGMIPAAEILAVRPHILFVCTGNTCRSLMAELLFKKLSKERGLDWTIGSAGTEAEPYFPVPPAVRTALAPEGIQDFLHVARHVTRELVEEADLILVMERRHQEDILDQWPQVAYKMRPLKSTDVADPIGKPEPVYAAACREIKQSLQEVIARHGRTQKPGP